MSQQIEPDPAMRQAATSHPLVEFREGLQQPFTRCSLLTQASLSTGLTPQSLQVFHRILKPSGRLVLVWNHLDRSDELQHLAFA